MSFLVAISVVLFLLVVNEIWWQTHKVKNEMGRKFIHITVGSFVAFWPFLLSWNQIRFLSVAFLVGIGISKYLNIFKAIHSVQRPTWGEFFFALAVGGVTLITQNEWIYMAALLQMGLADGLAAVIGTNFGKRVRYKIFGHQKSLMGSLTFYVISVIILVVFSFLSGIYLAPAVIISLALGASLIENIGVHGLDNLLIPLFVATVLANY